MATAAQELQRVIFGGTRGDLVHEWAGVWVVAERLSGNCYRGFSHGKDLVFSRKATRYPKEQGLTLVRQLDDDQHGNKVYLVRERMEIAEPAGEQVSGTLGQVAEGGCWYETEEKAKAAAQRWKIIGGSKQRRLAVAV